MNLRWLPLGWPRLRIKSRISVRLPRPRNVFFHRSLQCRECGPPPCQCSSVRGIRGGGAVHGGGPLSSLQHSPLPNGFNPVNHPFWLSELTQNCFKGNTLNVESGLDHTASNGVAHQT